MLAHAEVRARLHTELANNKTWYLGVYRSRGLRSRSSNREISFDRRYLHSGVWRPRAHISCDFMHIWGKY